jgi:formimidoylglutamate deiminase
VLLLPDLVLGPDGEARSGLGVEIDGGFIVAVRAAQAGEEDTALPGRMLVPGCVNAHSHAFQRALRGRVERREGAGEDDFWSWREAMYEAAGALDPDSIGEVSEACFREARAAGYTTIGEFHYVHHQPDGTPYDDPNALALSVVEAARRAGVRLVLLLAAYARAGAGEPPTARQRRFCDPTVERYLARVESLHAAVAGDPLITVGYAPHSVRALPRPWLEAIAAHAAGTGLPVHIHASEQPREVVECLVEHDCQPIELLDACGLLGPATTVVHATHASTRELDLLADRKAAVCACPTTEGNLGDGFLPAAGLWARAVPVCVGADSNVRLDPFEEAREMETCARRRELRRNVLVPEGDDGPSPSLWRSLTRRGAQALHLETGSIAPGMAADLVALDLAHPQLAGVAAADVPAAVLFAGSAALVRETWVAGHVATGT